MDHKFERLWSWALFLHSISWWYCSHYQSFKNVITPIMKLIFRKDFKINDTVKLKIFIFNSRKQKYQYSWLQYWSYFHWLLVCITSSKLCLIINHIFIHHKDLKTRKFSTALRRSNSVLFGRWFIFSINLSHNWNNADHLTYGWCKFCCVSLVNHIY